MTRICVLTDTALSSLAPDQPKPRAADSGTHVTWYSRSRRDMTVNSSARWHLHFAMTAWQLAAFDSPRRHFTAILATVKVTQSGLARLRARTESCRGKNRLFTVAYSHLVNQIEFTLSWTHRQRACDLSGHSCRDRAPTVAS